jgi:hypothetical protein
MRKLYGFHESGNQWLPANGTARWGVKVRVDKKGIVGPCGLEELCEIFGFDVRIP